MTGTERIFVSHHQFLVQTGTDTGDLELYTVGDSLVHLTGDGRLTVHTGPHTGRVPVTLTLGRPGPLDGWDAASEATLFCDRGILTVYGLMGDCPEPFRAVPIQTGLVRVRVHARNRRSDDVPEEPGTPPEEFEVFVWPVTEATGITTLEEDLFGPTWTQRPDQAATWALRQLLRVPDPPPSAGRLRHTASRPEWRYPRVTIRRPAVPSWPVSDGDVVIPVGDLELRLSPEPAPPGTFRATARWTARPGATGTVPDPEPSTVEFTPDGFVHSSVRAQDAVLLGLMWDLVLAEQNTRHPWQPVFAAAAARAAQKAAEHRRLREQQELRRWGGRMPSQRVRSLAANTHMLWSLDPDLVEALAAAAPDEQRATARWSARRACSVARLDTVGWIVEALDAMDRGAPLPPEFDDEGAVFTRLLSDPDVPSTVVRAPDGHPNWSQQALAFPALLAAGRPDPLVAAVDAVGTTAWAFGDEHRRFLIDTRIEFPFLRTSSKG